MPTPLSDELCRVFRVSTLESLLQPVDEALQRTRIEQLVRYVSMADAAFKEHAGQEGPIGAVAAALAVAQGEALDQVRASEARFELAVANSGIAVWEADLINNTTIFRSAGYHRMLGYEPEEVPVGMEPIRAFLSAESIAAIELASKCHQESRTPSFEVEVPARTKSGAVCWLRIQGRVTERDGTGRPMRMIGTNIDITSMRVASEEMRLARDAAEMANRSKSAFLANMSHEIRTPMNGVVGLTELCLDTELTAEQREYLEMIRTSGSSLMDVINDILDFSKIDAGKVELDPRRFSARTLFSECIRLLAVPASEKGIELVLAIDPGVPDRVIADVTRVRQVVINLLGNAVKFTETGEVCVRVSTVDVQPGRCVLSIHVSDTGIGIAPENLSMIFESFSQGDSSVTRRFGGTGLGLAISRRLATMLGGQLSVTSKLGAGSEFRFQLPVQTESIVEARSASPLANRHVLIVDKCVSNAAALKSLMRHWGMRVRVAANQEQALAELIDAASKGDAIELLLQDAATVKDPWAPQLLHAGVRPKATIAMNTMSARRAASRAPMVRSLCKPIVESELWDGLTAAFTDAPVPQQNAMVRASTPSSGLHVLVAEDNLINQRLVSRLLEKLGHRVTIADNGAEAISLYSQHEFDLVLMDLQMPVVGGEEATKRLRAIDCGQNRHVPIVAMTAHVLDGDRERCLMSGMDDYVAKPIGARELADAIQRASR